MQLCLSARMFAVSGARNQFELGLDDFVQFAVAHGYDGVALRPGQLDGTNPPEEADRIARLLEEKGMVCSFMRGGALADQESYEAYCRMVDNALRVDCRLVQPSIRDESGIPWAQELCDYAAERSVRICPQLHGNTLHETVPKCLELFGRVDRSNFGLNFEASHLLLQKQEIQNGAAVRAIGDRIFTVCVQNYKLEDDGFVSCLPGDPDGVDFEDVFGALKDIGYDGAVTHMSGSHPGMDNGELCRLYVQALRPLM